MGRGGLYYLQVYSDHWENGPDLPRRCPPGPLACSQTAALPPDPVKARRPSDTTSILAGPMRACGVGGAFPKQWASSNQGCYRDLFSELSPGTPVNLWILAPYPKPPKWKSLDFVTTPPPANLRYLSSRSTAESSPPRALSCISYASSLGWKFRF